MKELNFILKINGENISSFKKTNKGYIFNTNGKDKKLNKSEDSIVVVCSNCDSKIEFKTINHLLKLNKPFLCRKCRNSGELNGMFGKNHSDETKLKLSKIMSGENNPFYNKIHSKETKILQSKIKIGKYSGEKNPMYGLSLLELWTSKYGYDEAIKMWETKKLKSSKKMIGDKNPMYGKKIKDIWIQKYGENIANEKLIKWRKRIKESLIKFYKDNPKLKNYISQKLKGRTFSNEHLRKLRLAQINYINTKLLYTNHKIAPHFNMKACHFLDKVAKITNSNIQHALNGGEYYISKLGYWVDGYDEKNNIVYEYYEKFHKYKVNKDNIRKGEIENLLKCKFIIINEGDEENFLDKIRKNEI